MNDLVIIAIILIALHLVAGIIGAIVAGVLVRRLAGRGLPAMVVIVCGLLGALAAIALVLAAFPYLIGLIAAPFFAGLLVFISGKLRTN